MDASHPSGSVAQPQIQNKISVYPSVEGLDDPLVEIVGHCQKGLLQDIPLRVLKNCLNNRQKVLLKGVLSARNIFFYLILKQIKRIFINRIDILSPFVAGKSSLIKQVVDLSGCVDDFKHDKSAFSLL